MIDNTFSIAFTFFIFLFPFPDLSCKPFRAFPDFIRSASKKTFAKVGWGSSLSYTYGIFFSSFIILLLSLLCLYTQIAVTTLEIKRMKVLHRWGCEAQKFITSNELIRSKLSPKEDREVYVSSASPSANDDGLTLEISARYIFTVENFTLINSFGS